MLKNWKISQAHSELTKHADTVRALQYRMQELEQIVTGGSYAKVLEAIVAETKKFKIFASKFLMSKHSPNLRIRNKKYFFWPKIEFSGKLRKSSPNITKIIKILVQTAIIDTKNWNFYEISRKRLLDYFSVLFFGPNLENLNSISKPYRCTISLQNSYHISCPLWYRPCCARSWLFCFAPTASCSDGSWCTVTHVRNTTVYQTGATI